MDKNVEDAIFDEVEAVFLKHQGELSAWEIDSVFSRLRLKATGQKRAAMPKPAIRWFISDLYGTNLKWARDDYDWTGYAPTSRDGSQIDDIILLDANGNPPAGYAWLPGNQVLQKQDEQAADAEVHETQQPGDGFWATAPGAADVSEGMVWVKTGEGLGKVES